MTEKESLRKQTFSKEKWRLLKGVRSITAPDLMNMGA